MVITFLTFLYGEFCVIRIFRKLFKEISMSYYCQNCGMNMSDYNSYYCDSCGTRYCSKCAAKNGYHCKNCNDKLTESTKGFTRDLNYENKESSHGKLNNQEKNCNTKNCNDTQSNTTKNCNDKQSGYTKNCK